MCATPRLHVRNAECAHVAGLTRRCVRASVSVALVARQGTGRIEHMLPFAPPFNDSTVYADPRLLTLIGDFLGEMFKMELQTVITSPAGSSHQRWHQGWRYLFHPDER